MKCMNDARLMFDHRITSVGALPEEWVLCSGGVVYMV